jgi:sortase A
VVTVPPTATPTTQPDETPSTTTPEVSFVPEEAGPEGSTLGRIAIPKIDLDDVMFEGVTRDTLKKGPGHMPGTPVPGQPGNAVVSGHRTTYGRPFYDLDALSYGDRIEVETATGMHVYEVRKILIVQPTDVSVTEPMAGAWLTLTTCNPRFSAAERLVVQAVLVAGPNLDYANLLAKQAEGSEKST